MNPASPKALNTWENVRSQVWSVDLYLYPGLHWVDRHFPGTEHFKQFGSHTASTKEQILGTGEKHLDEANVFGGK